MKGLLRVAIQPIGNIDNSTLAMPLSPPPISPSIQKLDIDSKNNKYHTALTQLEFDDETYFFQVRDLVAVNGIMNTFRNLC